MQSRRRIAVSAAQAEWPCFKVAVTPPSVFPVRRAPRKSCPRARRIYVTTASLLSRTSDTALTASVETNVYWAIIRAGSRRAALGWRYLNNRLLWLLRFLCLSWFPPPPLHFHHTSRKAFQLFRDNSSAFLMPAVARRVGERRGQQTISRSRRLLSWQKKIVCFLCCIIKLPNKVNLGRAGLHKSPYRITQGANFVFQASIFLFFPFFLKFRLLSFNYFTFSTLGTALLISSSLAHVQMLCSGGVRRVSVTRPKAWLHFPQRCPGKDMQPHFVPYS